MDFTHDWEKMRDFHKLTQEEFLASYEYVSEEEYIATARIVDAVDNPHKETMRKFKDHVASLEGRDLMYFLISDCMDSPDADPEFKWIFQKIEGDGITAFMTDHISDHSVMQFIEECIDD